MDNNASLFNLKEYTIVKQELNRVKTELDRVKTELNEARHIAEYQQNCNMERGFKIKELEEENKTLRVELENNSKELEVCKELLNTSCDVILSIAPTHHKTRKDVMENLYLIIGGGKGESL